MCSKMAILMLTMSCTTLASLHRNHIRPNCFRTISLSLQNFWKWKTKKGTSRELRQRNQDSLNTGASKMRHVQNIQSYRDRAPQQSNSLGGRMCHIDYSTFLKPISYQTGVRLIDSSAWLRAPISNALYQGLCGILHPASRQARRAYLYVIGASQLFRSL